MNNLKKESQTSNKNWKILLSIHIKKNSYNNFANKNRIFIFSYIVIHDITKEKRGVLENDFTIVNRIIARFLINISNREVWEV